MAILTRAALIAKINLFITTNGNKEITGAQLNEILQDISDSGFMQLDEIRNALSVLYQNVGTPSDWNGGTAPVTQNLVNDELAQRLTSLEIGNSLRTAYVSPTGSDIIGEYQVGNPLKPFKTFAAALSAVPSSYFIIKSLGGSFTNVATENWIDTGKSNGVIDLSGTVINSTFVRVTGDNVTILLEGGEINTSTSGTLVTLGGSSPVKGCKLIGGRIVTSVVSGTGIVLNDNCTAQDVYVQASSGVGISTATPTTNKSKIERCTIVAGRGSLGGGCNIIDSIYRCTSFCIEMSGDPITAENSTFVSTSSSHVMRGNGGTTALRFYGINCYIRNDTVAGKGLFVGNTQVNDLFLKACIVSAEAGCIEYTSSTTTLVNVDHVYKECTLYSDIIDTIFIEPVSYSASFLGNIRSINNTYSQTQALVVGTKITEYNKIEITGLQLPEIDN